MSWIKKGLKEPVLLVDDEKELLELMVEIAQSLGMEVLAASSVESAEELIGERRPFLVVSDFRMAGKSGLDLCEKVKSNFFSVPFVLATGFADKDVAVASLNSGVSEILEKPYPTEKLIAILNKYAERRSAELEAERLEMEEIRVGFVEESLGLLTDFDALLLRLNERPIEPMVIDGLFRKIHTIKGGAGAIEEANPIAHIGHEFESSLSCIKKGEFLPSDDLINVYLSSYDVIKQMLVLVRDATPITQDLLDRSSELTQALIQAKELALSAPKTSASNSEAQIAVSVATETSKPVSLAPAENVPGSDEDEGLVVSNEKLGSFMNVSGELIVLKNTIQTLVRDPNNYIQNQAYKRQLNDLSSTLGKLTDRLQEEIMEVRKVTINRALSTVPRIVRQVSQGLKKKIVLNTKGWDLGVDKTIAKALSGSVTHMVRNCIDHGIEMPEKRRELGKPAEGTLTIHSYESQGNVYLKVTDDGAGINRDRVLAKAIKNQMLTEEQAKQLKDSEVLDLIFLPGFSTAEKTTSVSGRGVGMDVVRSSVLALGGKVMTESVEGQGTTITLEIPIPKTVLVEQTILVDCTRSTLAIPLHNISRIATVEELALNEVNHVTTCQFMGRTIRLGTYRELLKSFDEGETEPGRPTAAIILQHKDQYIGLLVDAIQNQLEAVIRPFDRMVEKLPGFKGTTVLENNRVAYVVSAEEFVELGLRLRSMEEAAA